MENSLSEKEFSQMLKSQGNQFQTNIFPEFNEQHQQFLFQKAMMKTGLVQDVKFGENYERK